MARRKHEALVRAQPRSETAVDRDAAALPRPPAPGVGPAGIVIRLAVPFRPTRRPADGSAAAAAAAEMPASTDFAGALEASYGARAEDVVDLVRASMAAATDGSEGGEGRSTPCVSPWSGGGGNSNSSGGPLPIVGFSIDVGPACLADALDGSAATLPPFGQKRPDGPGPAPTAAAGAAPGEAVPSTSLAESIDAAVAFAVKMAGVAAEAAALGGISSPHPRGAAAPAADAEAAGGREEERQPAVGNGSSASRLTPATTVQTLGSSSSSSSSSSSHPPFSFRRLHVTGLGEGGARGEPLVALKAALSRHLPRTGLATPAGEPGGGRGTGATGGGSEGALLSCTSAGKPVVVSADATEHLVAGGAWSTVAAIIGRKSVPPKAGGADGSSCGISSGEELACADGERCSAAGEEVGDGDGSGAGGAMYYIDDGCYGSLSGALLRGVQMQPSPLRVQHRTPRREHGSITATAVVAAAPGDTRRDREHEARSPVPSTPRAGELPCTVWGPTCDGLDCVCRITQLPHDMEPGRDWLFFADVGIRGGADATDFNGLKPLDSFYCVRRRHGAAPSLARATSPPLARAVSP